MSKNKFHELAVVLTEQVRANAFIDWDIREDVQAQLRVIIKHTL